MAITIIRQLFVALAALQAIYVATVVALYLDLRSKIRFPVPRLLVHIGAFVLIYHGYQKLIEPETLRMLLPLQKGHGSLFPTAQTILPPLIEQALPLVLESIRLILTVAAQISIIDKLLYIVSCCRIPFILTIGIVSAMATAGALVLYTAISGPQWRIAQLQANLQKLDTYVVDPLAAILLFLTVIAGIMAVQALVTHIRRRRTK